MNAKHRNKTMLLSLMVCGLTFAAGCAPGRLDDLKDCGQISIGVGTGLEIHAKIGSLTQATFGLGTVLGKIGHEDRNTNLFWSEGILAWPMTYMVNVTPEGYTKYDPYNLNLSGVRGPFFHNSTNSESRYYWIPMLAANKDYDPLAFSEITDLHIGGTLFVISAHVGVNPLEIVDFALGFVGLDIAGDDPEPKLVQPAETPQPEHTSALTGIND